MRALLLLPLAAAPILAFACDDSSSSGAPTNFDAGPTTFTPPPVNPPGPTDASTPPPPPPGKDAGQGKAPPGIYVADTNNDRIVYMSDMTGAGWTTLGTLAANGGDAAAPGAFSNPRDVFVSSANYIYVADNNNSRIVRMDDLSGAGWTTFGTTGTGVNQMNGPFGVTVDANERIYIADLGNSRIIRVDDMTGAGWTTFGIAGTDGGAFQMSAVERVAVTPDGGTIYCTDSSYAHIAQFAGDGTNWQSFGVSGNGPGMFSDPFGIAVEPAGTLLVADIGSIRITRIAPLAMTGTEYNPPGAGQCAGVSTAGGKIYFSDTSKGQITRMDDITGTNSVTFGSNGTGQNQFKAPYGIFVK